MGETLSRESTVSSRATPLQRSVMPQKQLAVRTQNGAFTLPHATTSGSGCNSARALSRTKFTRRSSDRGSCSSGGPCVENAPYMTPPADGECYLLLLPDELIARITNDLTVREMERLFATCTLLHRLHSVPSIQGRLWQPQCWKKGFLFPDADGDWKSVYRVNHGGNGSEKCPECKAWILTGERHLHGTGLCYHCDRCGKGQPLSHRLTCATCRHCHGRFSLLEDTPCLTHPPGALMECSACEKPYPGECTCDRAHCSKCRFADSEKPVHYCSEHMLRMTCCSLIVHGESPRPLTMSLREFRCPCAHRTNTAVGCYLRNPGQFRFPPSGCNAASHVPEFDVEEEFPLFIRAVWQAHNHMNE